MLKNEAATRVKEILGTLEGVLDQSLRSNTSPEQRAEATKRYKKLLVRLEQLRKETSDAGERARAYKHRLYRNSFEIAKGDTWEEVIEQLKAQTQQLSGA